MSDRYDWLMRCLQLGLDRAHHLALGHFAAEPAEVAFEVAQRAELVAQGHCR